jgi:ABC-type amino acid transport substrate-binding protein
MRRFNISVVLGTFVLISAFPNIINADSDILTPQENLWLKSRNNTIVVYPEKNFPPYSYQNSSGTPQGLSIDYIEIIAKKIGAKIEYLPARSLSQILDDFEKGYKGDIVTSLTDTKDKESYLYFSDIYVTSPAVIVVRKDLDKGDTLTLSDLTGKKVAIGSKYAVEDFVRVNNPRVVIESVTDDESGLQQVVLGEVDAAIMDIASLSYYLSKQVLNSVKVVGSTGFEYKLSFAVPKDKEILQSILDKGLQQISTNDRKIITEKWIVVPNELKPSNSLASFLKNNLSNVVLYLLLSIIIVILLIKRNHMHFSFKRRFKLDEVNELKQEIIELEDTSKSLMDELNEIKILEENIKEKVKKIETQ